MCGTEIAYPYAMCGTEIAYGASRFARHGGSASRFSSAKSIAYSRIFPTLCTTNVFDFGETRSPYALYQHCRCIGSLTAVSVWCYTEFSTEIGMIWCYDMLYTDIGYGATTCFVLRSGMVLPDAAARAKPCRTAGTP
eukprot:1979937-Rhodomonas_salina.1